MKKIAILIFIILIFSLSGCSYSDNVIYYGYFKDTVLVIAYSSSKNTLYEIKIPLEMVVLWSKISKTDSMNVAMNSFTGQRENGFMTGSSQVLIALRDILNALSDKKDATEEDRLNIIVNRDDILNNSQILNKLNRLCSTDFSALIKALKGKHADAVFIDTSLFLTTDNIVETQSFFQKWMNQVLGV